jgi:alcohol dehydrogenase (cytochrome c)
MDEVFENMLVDYGGRKALFKMGKLGVLWELDRRTGAFVKASDLGYQNLVKIEPRTGIVTYMPGKLPTKVGETVDWCPSATGFKSLRAMAYSPETQALYVPLELTCQRGSFAEVKQEVGGGGVGAGRSERYMHPDAAGNLGEFIAMSISGQVLWRHRQRAPFNTAALTTAGGLVFVGDWNRYIVAYDVKTGDKLWQTRSIASASGFPISYAVRGRQYVAIPVGTGAGSWATGAGQFIPDMKRPSTGNAIMVFALPEGATTGARRGR